MEHIGQNQITEELTKLSKYAEEHMESFVRNNEEFAGNYVCKSQRWGALHISIVVEDVKYNFETSPPTPIKGMGQMTIRLMDVPGVVSISLPVSVPTEHLLQDDII